MSTLTEDLTDLFDHVWGRFRARMAGLGDAEWDWRPTRDAHLGLRRRIAHLTGTLREDRNPVWLGLPPVSPPAEPEPEPESARAALAAAELAYARWRGWLAEVPQEALAEPIGAVAGPYGEATRLSFVLHLADELVHHTAEAALLRDLYAGTH
ncbi:DinB family protein [Streptomyces hoynatensis]|nr:DinB family protein [Streptomyces hoynatensis]